MMSGERDLDTLLRSMKPEMQEGIFVFCTLPEGREISANLKPVHIFHEREGTAFVVRREEAEAAGLPYQFASRLITLTVHSSLEAVGFLAAITAPLAEAGISVNAVSAFLSRSSVCAGGARRRCPTAVARTGRGHPVVRGLG
jgi:uncharacterized protein